MTEPNYESTFYIHEQAQRHGMSVNSDIKRVSAVLAKLEANEVKYGAPYCPCLNNHTPDTICPCKYMRRHKACRCGLYVKRKDD